jgi:hypothetical protein
MSTAFRGAASNHNKRLIYAEENDVANTLQGKRIAILATDGFEQSELLKPRQALDEAGARTQVVSPKEVKIKSWD